MADLPAPELVEIAPGHIAMLKQPCPYCGAERECARNDEGAPMMHPVPVDVPLEGER